MEVSYSGRVFKDEKAGTLPILRVCENTGQRTVSGFPTLFVAVRVEGDSVRRIRIGAESKKGEKMNGTRKVFIGLMSMCALIGGTQAATITVTGDQNLGAKVNRITSSQTWTADNEYKLDGLITIGSGVTLTIQPGTVIRGMNAYNTGELYRPGTLIVEKGGKLIANGTASNPIVFTDEWDDHFPWKTGVAGTAKTRTYMYQKGAGNWLTLNQTYDYGRIGDLHGVWGGVVVCGKALLNYDQNGTASPFGEATITVEGTSSTLGLNGGGTDDNDSSGEISYVQIRYGGSVLTDGGEINGLTMYGVGRGTKLHHIEVYNNQDDMFEFFGGCVNSKYLVAWGAGDDLFDSDNGYRGKNQFLFGVQRDMDGAKVESGASDKGMEMDGGEKGTAAMVQLFSASVWANITLIGDQFTSPAASASTTRNIAISMRDNASPRIYNSIFMDFSSVATMIENREADAAWTVNGITLSPSRRFATASTAANLPASTYNGGALAGMDAAAARNYLYGDGVLADDYQACIRGCYFWNFNKDNVGASSDGRYPTVTGSSWTTTYPWTSSGVGSGPYVSGSADTAYQGWTSSANRNINQWNKNTSGETVTADTSNMMPIQYRHRVSQTRTATTAFNLSHVNPCAANTAVSNATAVADAWLTPVRFMGAFASDKNWAKGWTTIGTLKSKDAANADIFGVFGATSLASALVVEGDVVVGGSVSAAPAGGSTTYITNTVTEHVTNTVTTVITNGVNGIVYQDTSTAVVDGGNNSVAAAGLQTSPVVTYHLTSAGTYQLQTTPSLTTPEWTIVKTFTVASASEGSPVTVNLTDIIGETPPNGGDSRFYKLLKQ